MVRSRSVPKPPACKLRTAAEVLWFIAAAALLLAFSNGANDNFKGFATVWGSGTLTYRSALLLATAATLAGSLTSMVLAGELLKAFSGAGLVPSDVAAAPVFMAAVGTGAALTVILATRTGFPISTTHALLGGMLGAAFALQGGGLDVRVLAEKFVIPLLLSPVVAALLGMGAYRSLQFYRRGRDCICLVYPAHAPLTPAGRVGVNALAPAPSPTLVVAPAAACESTSAPALQLAVSPLLDKLHIASGATICFARSVNDTPKLAALLIGAQLSGVSSMALIGIFMVAGGWLFARRVARTMSLRLNRMDATQGLSANVITAAAVLLASKFGLPVSTTHIAVGSIGGVGLRAGTADWPVFRSVLISWVATLPLAALAAWTAATALH